jgi:hypothetical protein
MSAHLRPEEDPQETPNSRYRPTTSVLILCNWMVATRLSQKALRHALKAGAITAGEAPAMVN